MGGQSNISSSMTCNESKSCMLYNWEKRLPSLGGCVPCVLWNTWDTRFWLLYVWWDLNNSNDLLHGALWRASESFYLLKSQWRSGPKTSCLLILPVRLSKSIQEIHSPVYCKRLHRLRIRKGSSMNDKQKLEKLASLCVTGERSQWPKKAQEVQISPRIWLI